MLVTPSREGDYLSNLLGLREVGGIDQNRIRSAHGLGSVHLISKDNLPRLLGDLVIDRRAAKPLDKPAPGTLTWIGNQKNLQCRIRKDHCPDIAAIYYHIKRLCCFANLLIHPVAHAAHLRNTGNARRHRFPAHFILGALAMKQRSESGVSRGEGDALRRVEH